MQATRQPAHAIELPEERVAEHLHRLEVVLLRVRCEPQLLAAVSDACAELIVHVDLDDRGTTAAPGDPRVDEELRAGGLVDAVHADVLVQEGRVQAGL